MINKLFSQNPKEDCGNPSNKKVLEKIDKPGFCDVISVRRGEIISSIITGFISGLIVGGIVIYTILSHER
jgi:hypothetical protein